MLKSWLDFEMGHSLKDLVRQSNGELGYTRNKTPSMSLYIIL